jgi:hypothetical protein
MSSSYVIKSHVRRQEVHHERTGTACIADFIGKNRNGAGIVVVLGN